MGLSRLVGGYEDGDVVKIARGPAAGLRWARYHRYVNGYWLGVYELPLQHLIARELRPSGITTRHPELGFGWIGLGSFARE